MLDVVHICDSRSSIVGVEFKWRRKWGARSLLSRSRQSHDAPIEKLRKTNSRAEGARAQ
jgi:hypothetical protein